MQPPDTELDYDDDELNNVPLTPEMEAEIAAYRAAINATLDRDVAAALAWLDANDDYHLGGEGSGNFDHAGRPGQVGGSSGGARTITVGGRTISLPPVWTPPAPEQKFVKPFVPVDPTSAEHKAWIAGTKVVDSKGEPLTVYHTSGEDFSDFTLDKYGKSGFAGLSGVRGVFFSTRKDFAYGPIRYPAQLKVENPLHIDAKASKGRPYEMAREQLTDKHDAVAIKWGDGSTEWIVLNPANSRIVGPKERSEPQSLYRDKLQAFLLGGEGSGNFGHSGRPGEVGGSGPSGGVPVEPGTTPIPKGMIRGYHYTRNLDDVEREGLRYDRAKGASYGEPNAIWFSTVKPGDFKDYVEVFLDPDEVVQSPLDRRDDKTSAASLAKIAEFNEGDHDYMVVVEGNTVTPDRFVTTHRPWHDKYRYITRQPETLAKAIAGDFDWLMDDPEHGPALSLIKAEAAKTSKLSYREKLAILLGGEGSGNFGHAGRPGEIGGSAPDGEGGEAEDNPYALAPGAPRGGEGQQTLFEYAPEHGSEAQLRAEAERAVVSLDAMLPDAIENAEFAGKTATEWDELDKDAQIATYDKWAEDEYSSDYAMDAGSSAGDDYINENISGQDVFDKMLEDEEFTAWLTEQGIDVETLEFQERNYSGDIMPNSMDVKDTNGELLPADKRAELDTRFRDLKRDVRDTLVDELRDSDSGYQEAVSDAEREAVRSNWNNLDDDERFSIATTHGTVEASNVEKEAPGTWKWDGEPSDDEYIQTRAIALELASARTQELLNSRGLASDPTQAATLASNIAEEFWTEWKSSSSSPMGTALQMAVAEEMGTLPTAHLTDEDKQAARDAIIGQFTTSDERAKINPASTVAGRVTAVRMLPEDQQAAAMKALEKEEQAGNDVLYALGMGRAKAYVRAQWETTQFVASKAGIKEVNLYRAVILESAEVEAGAVGSVPVTEKRSRGAYGTIQATPLPSLSLKQNAVASATTKPDVANSWNGVGGVTPDATHERVVLRFKAPVTSTFSLPVFGQNVHEESEVVLVGTKGLKWDAWRTRAPQHESVPLYDPRAIPATVPKGLVVDWPDDEPTVNYSGQQHLAKDKTPKPKPIVVDMWRNVPGHWLQRGWRDHKEIPLPPKGRLKSPHARASDEMARIIVRGMKKGMLPTFKKLSSDTWNFGSSESGNYGHEGRPGQVGGSAPRDGGHWEKGDGGTEHWVGGGTPTADPRTFKGNEGYDWTEHDDRVNWAAALPKADVDAINEYAGFGYGDINAHLRGAYTPNIVDEKVRDATPEEVASYKHPKFGRGEAHNYDENDPLNKVEDGRIVHHFTYEGGYKQNDQEANERNRRDWYTIEKAGPDTKYVKGLEKTADTINDSIRERGYVLPEPMSVNRAAYVPGLSYDDLKAQEGGVMEEKGFTSTMVGNPSNRLDGYVMMGKSESIYKRTGGKSVQSDEVGTAMRIEIVLPEGAKVAVVEPVRRLEYDYPRIQDPEAFKHPEWLVDSEGKPNGLKVENYTIRDYTAKPTIITKAIQDKGSRREAEVLIGSGAQYRIVSVKQAPPLHSHDGSMKPIEVVDVKLEYIGGGSSDPNAEKHLRRDLGSAKSGHWGHAGVIGQKGGSAPGSGPQLNPKEKATWYRHNAGWNESDGERPYGWDWPPDGDAYVPPEVRHKVIRMKGRDADSGTWGGSHHGSSVITGDAAKQMGIGGYKDLDATKGASSIATRMLEEIANDAEGSEEPLFHTFENVANTVFSPGDTMRLPLMASAGKPELGYAHRGFMDSQRGMPVVFAFPKGTPMVGYYTTTKKDLEDLDMPNAAAQHKEQGYVWDEAIVAGGFEVERVETVYIGSQHKEGGIKEGEPVPQLYGQVVHLKPTEVFDPATQKWKKRG